MSTKEEWSQKLVGKKIVEGAVTNDPKSFSKNDLPQGTRVLAPNQPHTLDFRPDRLNVFTNDVGVCERVDMF